MAYSKKAAAKASSQGALQGTIGSSIAVISVYFIKHAQPDMPGEVVGAVSIVITALATAVIGFAQHMANHFLNIGTIKS